MRAAHRRPLGGRFAVAGAFLALTLLIAYTTWRVLLYDPPPPPVSSPPAPLARLSPQVVFVVLDGLRYDYATDAQKAPNLAAHMEHDAHAEVTAGRVTMTSAAVLTFATGLRGTFAQVVTNVDAGQVVYDSVIARARAAGRRIAVVGDDTWPSAFGNFDITDPDREGLSIEIDSSRRMLASAARVVVADPRVDLLVLHVLATDHLGHAFGSASSRYLAFLRDFDERFEAFLASLPRDATVLVTSDHGMTDSGTHGFDVPIARRTFLFAYGPGVRPGADLGVRDQVDLPQTLSALLGLPSPAHSRGTVLTGLLDIGPADEASLLCADARRCGSLLDATGTRRGAAADAVASAQRGCADTATDMPTRARIAEAAVRAYDASLDRGRARIDAIGGVVVTFLFLVALGVTYVAEHARRADTLAGVWRLAAAALYAVSLALTYAVELLPTPWPNVVRAALFVVANLALLVAVVAPSRAAALLERAPGPLIALALGSLAMSYPADTQVQAWVALVMTTLVWLFAPNADLGRIGRIDRGRRELGVPRCVGVLALLALTYPFGVSAEPRWPYFGNDSPAPLSLFAIASVALWLWSGRTTREPGRAPSSNVTLACVFLGVAASILLRAHVGSAVGLSATVVTALGGFASLARGRRTLGFGLLLASFAWVSREFEVPCVLIAAIVVEAVAQSASARDDVAAGARPWAIVTLSLALFGAGYLIRIVLTGGLDFTGMDWAAGTFHEPSPSPRRLAAFIIWKYLACDALILAIFLGQLPGALRGRVAAVSFVMAFARFASAAAMLFFCNSSFWTSYRCLTETGPTLLMALAAAVAYAVLSERPAAGAPRQVAVV